MLVRSAEAVWQGSLLQGKGTMAFGGGAFKGAYSFASRFGQGMGTNPEELIAAAHAGCFSMALSGDLGGKGYPPQSVNTTAKVYVDQIEGGYKIAKIELDTEADVPGIDEATFLKIAEGAKAGCPVSKALASVEITLKAKLVKR
jgi:lipoyl-dependent peroxiredoxin